MEIVLALMLLGASPIGAAMLDKPTRNRFVKFVQVHNPFRDKDPDVTLAMDPRNKDWTQDTILATMWTEAFKYYQITGRDRKLKWALEKHKSYETKKDQILPMILEAQVKIDKVVESGAFVSYETKQTVKDAWDAYHNMGRGYRDALDKDEVFLLSLVQKYGEELEYNQDLIRLAAAPVLPVMDYSALALSVAK